MRDELRRRAEQRYDLVLVAAGPRPRRVARTIASFTDRRTSEALGLLQTIPVQILERTSYATAEGMRDELKSLGAMLEVRGYEVEDPPAPPRARERWTGAQVAGVIVAIVVALALFGLLLFVGFLQAVGGWGCTPDGVCM